MQKLKVIVSLITEDNDYQQEQASAARAAAQKLNLDLDILFANNDGVNQSLQLLQAIQSQPETRPNAIVVESVGTPMPQVAQAAASAHIGWILLNRGADYIEALRTTTSAPIFCLATNNEEVGHLMGKQINALMPGGGSILCITGPSTSEVARQRTAGMLTTKRHNIEVKTIRGDWTELSANSAVKSWLKLSGVRHPNIGLVAAQNDAMAIGARKAIEEAGGFQERESLLNLPFLGCDGTENKGRKYVQMKLLRATIITPALTGLALEMLSNSYRLHSQPPEQTLIAPRPFPPLAEVLPN